MLPSSDMSQTMTLTLCDNAYQSLGQPQDGVASVSAGFLPAPGAGGADAEAPQERGEGGGRRHVPLQ